METDVKSKRLAALVAIMIDSRLIWYKHYYGWANDLIKKLPEPPLWIIELATIKYYRKAIEAIDRFVQDPPFEAMDYLALSEEYIACLILRHQSGSTSWATFLNDAGSYSDASGGRNCCEYFYEMLTELEDHEYRGEVACRQRATIETEYRVEIDAIRPLFETFMKHFRDYVAGGD